MSGDGTDPEDLDGISTISEAKGRADRLFHDYAIENYDDLAQAEEKDSHYFLHDLKRKVSSLADHLEKARFKNDYAHQAHADEDLDNISPHGEIAEAHGALHTVYTHLSKYSDIFKDPDFESLRRSLESELEAGLNSTEESLDQTAGLLSEDTYSKAD